MLNIAICDDEVSEINKIKEIVEKYNKEHYQKEIKIFTYTEPKVLLADIELNNNIHIIILDIYMNDYLGTQVAKKLRNNDCQAEIIFITTSIDHAVEAFEVNAIHYLLKPFKERDIFKALDKAIEKIKSDDSGLTLKTTNGILRVLVKNVVYTETARNNYQYIYTIFNEKIEVRITAADLFELLSSKGRFIRAGASVNVNLKYVRQVSKDNILLDINKTIFFPYRLNKQIKNHFLNYQIKNNN